MYNAPLLLTLVDDRTGCRIMEAKQQNAERVTVEQRSRWDSSSRSYNDLFIRKGGVEPNARQVIAAVQHHLQNTTGDL